MAMESKINICGANNDLFARYKMDRLNVIYEGKRNNKRTIILNVNKISKQLTTHSGNLRKYLPIHITKYFGYEYSIHSIWDTKKERCVLKGYKTGKELQESLHKFIKHFMVCQRESCQLPELEHFVNNKSLFATCNACGFEIHFESNHKILQYIIKNPMKTVKGNINISCNFKKSKKKSKKRKNVENINIINKNNNNKNSETDEEKLERNPVKILRQFVNKHERSCNDIIFEIKRIQIANKMDQNGVMKLIFESLLNGHNDYKDFKSSIKAYCPVLSYFKELYKAKGLSLFLGYFEKLLVYAVIDDFHLYKRGFEILEILYDKDVLTDEEILKWYDKPKDDVIFINTDDWINIQSKIKIFIDWLRNDTDDNDSDPD